MTAPWGRRGAGRTALGESGSGEFDNARSIGPGLYSTHGRTADDPERLLYAEDGDVVWSTTYRDVFGDGYSSDYGWAWRKDTERGLMLGWARTESTEPSRYDYSKMTSVALDLDDGTVRWRAPGVQLWCGGADEALHTACDMNGVVLDFGDPQNREDTTVAEGRIKRVGLDLDTGKPTWTHDLGASTKPLQLLDGLASTSRHAVVAAGHEHRILDLEDGTTSAVPWTALPCSVKTSYRFPEWDVPDNELVDYRGATSTASATMTARMRRRRRIRWSCCVSSAARPTMPNRSR